VPTFAVLALGLLTFWPSKVAGPMAVVAAFAAWHGFPTRVLLSAARVGNPCHRESSAAAWVGGVAMLGMVPLWPAWLSGRWSSASVVAAAVSALVAALAGEAASGWARGGEARRRRLAFLLGSALLVHGALLLAYVAVAARRHPDPMLAVAAIVGTGVAVPLGLGWLHERRGGVAVALWLAVILFAAGAFRAAGGGR